MAQDLELARLVAGIQQVRREREEIKEVLGILRPFLQPIVANVQRVAEGSRNTAQFDGVWSMVFLAGGEGGQLLFEVKADIRQNGSTWEYRIELQSAGKPVVVVRQSTDHDLVDTLTPAQVGAVHGCLQRFVMEVCMRARAGLPQLLEEFGDAANRATLERCS